MNSTSLQPYPSVYNNVSHSNIMNKKTRTLKQHYRIYIQNTYLHQSTNIYIIHTTSSYQPDIYLFYKRLTFLSNYKLLSFYFPIHAMSIFITSFKWYIEYYMVCAYIINFCIFILNQKFNHLKLIICIVE